MTSTMTVGPPRRCGAASRRGRGRARPPRRAAPRCRRPSAASVAPGTGQLPLPPPQAWPPSGIAMAAASSPVAKLTAPITIALAASTRPRRGLAVERDADQAAPVLGGDEHRRDHDHGDQPGERADEGVVERLAGARAGHVRGDVPGPGHGERRRPVRYPPGMAGDVAVRARRRSGCRPSRWPGRRARRARTARWPGRPAGSRLGAGRRQPLVLATLEGRRGGEQPGLDGGRSARAGSRCRPASSASRRRRRSR